MNILKMHNSGKYDEVHQFILLSGAFNALLQKKEFKRQQAKPEVEEFYNKQPVYDKKYQASVK